MSVSSKPPKPSCQAPTPVPAPSRAPGFRFLSCHLARQIANTCHSQTHPVTEFPRGPMPTLHHCLRSSGRSHRITVPLWGPLHSSAALSGQQRHRHTRGHQAPILSSRGVTDTNGSGVEAPEPHTVAFPSVPLHSDGARSDELRDPSLRVSPAEQRQHQNLLHSEVDRGF